MQMRQTATAALEGAGSIVRAIRRWAANSASTEVPRRLWGPAPWLALATLAGAGTALEIWLPDPRLLAGVLPPLTALAFVPETVASFAWSGAAAMGFVAAWRMRALRSASDDLGQPWVGPVSPGVEAFEAAALPFGAAVVTAAIAVQVVLGLNPETRIGSFAAIRSAASFVMVATVTAGVLTSRRQLGTAVGQLTGAAFTIWGIHLGIAYAVPWMTAWWEWIPGLGGGRRSAVPVHILFDLAVVSVAWMTLRTRMNDGLAWRPDSETENDSDSR